ncbi:Glucose transporter [Phytophthora cinnamomi]|uniref:Glucose transporter n=1 Tax=Phytophthora cinnamomi TaxID=4785 RepID=UPI00355973DB|nr:Glucose transporter [Phytophthora cinnamomi]
MVSERHDKTDIAYFESFDTPNKGANVHINAFDDSHKAAALQLKPKPLFYQYGWHYLAAFPTAAKKRAW